jgi:hypothetical protein
VFIGLFLELYSVSRPRVQPVRDPLGLGCHGVEIREFIPPQFRRTGTADRPWVAQYLVYCGWLVFELCFVVTMIVETKGS